MEEEFWRRELDYSLFEAGEWVEKHIDSINQNGKLKSLSAFTRVHWTQIIY